MKFRGSRNPMLTASQIKARERMAREYAEKRIAIGKHPSPLAGCFGRFIKLFKRSAK